MIEYPEMIRSLPDVDLNLPGVRAKLLQAGDKQVVFFEIEPIGALPPHAHRAQWGVVLEGEIDLTIGGQTRTYRPGDTYYIPDGVVHEARVRSKFKALDIFDEVARYQARK